MAADLAAREPGRAVLAGRLAISGAYSGSHLQLRTEGDRIVVQVEKSVDNALLYLASLRAGQREGVLAGSTAPLTATARSARCECSRSPL